MQITAEMKDGVSYVGLAGEATIYEAAELKLAFQEAISLGRPVHINLANVSAMDSAGFQQLYLAKREANARKQELHLLDHSDATRELLDLYGMGAFFGDPVVIPAGEPEKRRKGRSKSTGRTKK